MGFRFLDGDSHFTDVEIGSEFCVLAVLKHNCQVVEGK